MTLSVGVWAPGLMVSSGGDWLGARGQQQTEVDWLGQALKVHMGSCCGAVLHSLFPATSHQLKLVSSNASQRDSTHLVFQQPSRQAGLIVQGG